MDKSNSTKELNEVLKREIRTHKIALTVLSILTLILALLFLYSLIFLSAVKDNACDYCSLAETQRQVINRLLPHFENNTGVDMTEYYLNYYDCPYYCAV